MGNRFLNKWKEREPQPSISSKIKKIVKPSESVKEQIGMVTKRIDMQTQSLDMAVKRFENRDSDLFKCVVKAITDRDKARANILAGELWEIRKVEKMLSHASLALESVSMRLKTVSEVGDLVAILTPAASELNRIRTGMSTVLPEAGRELENIGSLLSDIVTTTNQSSETPVNIGITANPEAEKILEEAEFAVESRLREQLPEVAAGVTLSKKTELEV